MTKKWALVFVFMAAMGWLILEKITPSSGTGLFESLFKSLVIGSIAFLITLYLEVEGPIRKSSKFIEDLIKSNEDLKNQAKMSVESIENLSKRASQLEIQVRTSILGDLGRRSSKFVGENRETVIGKLLNDWIKEINIVIEGKSFKVARHALALDSYSIFWDLLIEEQKERTKKGEKSLNVLVIHSTSWRVWHDPIGKALLAKHKEFHNKGGTVTRILCGKEEKPPKDIVKTASDMNDAQVRVLYYNTKSPKVVVNFGFKWDFLYVEETKVAVIWSSEQNEDIGTSTYQIGDEFETRNLPDLWHTIEKGVNSEYRHEAEWWKNQVA